MQKNFTIIKKKFTLDAFGDVKVKSLENQTIINTQNISYDAKAKIITSKNKTVISDSTGNTFIGDNFFYSLENELIKVSNAKIIDIEKNIYQIDKAFINLKSNKLIGKDINIDLDNKSFQKNNEPRLNGKTIKSDATQSVITNGVFTTCKKTDSCPPWHLTAKRIKHDKKKKNYILQKCLA